MPQMIQMRDRFAHREELLLDVELALEQHGQQVVRGDRAPLIERVQLFGEPCAMMLGQRIDARANPDERQAVRGQHQRIVRQPRVHSDR